MLKNKGINDEFMTLNLQHIGKKQTKQILSVKNDFYG